MRAVIACLLLSTIHASSVDFTPYKDSYEVEGIRFESVAFRHEGKRILYSPPKQWTLSGDKAKLTLYPPGAALASASIQTLAVPEHPHSDAPSVQVLVELARQLVPSEAVKVEFGEPKAGTVGIGGRTVSEIGLTYSLFLQPLQASVFFLPRGDEFVAFQVVAKPADFPRLAKEFRDSLHTFQGL